MSGGDAPGWHPGWAAHTLLSVALSFWALLAYAAAFAEGAHLILGMVCWLVGHFLSILVHESGHALAALACRWRIIIFAVRPIGIQIPNRDFAFVGRHYDEDVGGWVTSVPRAPAFDTAARWGTIVAAGPLASLLLAAAGLAGWNGWPPHADMYGVELRYLALGVGLQALHGFLFSLLPVRGAHNSDGEKLWALLHSDTLYETGRPFIWLNTLLNSNLRLSRLPGWLIDQAQASSGGSEVLSKYMATLEIGRVLDSAPVDSVRARRLIDAYRERYGVDGWLAACDAYLAAVWERDPARAEAVLAEKPATAGLPHLSLAAEAALAARLGDAPLARSRLKDMRDALESLSPFEDLTFRDIHRQIEAVLA